MDDQLFIADIKSGMLGGDPAPRLADLLANQKLSERDQPLKCVAFLLPSGLLNFAR